MQKPEFLQQKIHYTLLQAMYWFSYASIWASRSAVLLKSGFDNTAIGIVSAIALLSASVIFQPIMSSMADKYEKYTSRKFCIGLCLVAMTSVICLIIFRQNLLLTSIFYIIVGICLLSTIPFVNAISMELKFDGIDVNYSVSRGLGSGSYAIGAMISGNILEKYSSTLLLPFCVINFLIYAVIFYFFRYGRRNQKRNRISEPAAEGSTLTEKDSENTTHKDALSIPAFLMKYPNYTVTMIAYGFLLATHCCLAAYTAQITMSVGGTDSQIGFALAVGGLVEVPAMFLMPILIKRFTLKKMFRFSAVTFIVKNLILLLANSIPLVYIGMMMQFFTCGMIIPCSVYYVGNHIDPANQVKGQSMMHLFSNALMTAIYLLFSGVLIDKVGIQSVLAIMVLSAVIGTALLFVSTKDLE